MTIPQINEALEHLRRANEEKDETLRDLLQNIGQLREQLQVERPTMPMLRSAAPPTPNRWPVEVTDSAQTGSVEGSLGGRRL